MFQENHQPVSGTKGLRHVPAEEHRRGVSGALVDPEDRADGVALVAFFQVILRKP